MPLSLSRLVLLLCVSSVQQYMDLVRFQQEYLILKLQSSPLSHLPLISSVLCSQNYVLKCKIDPALLLLKTL